jgi:hypothetical protein
MPDELPVPEAKKSARAKHRWLAPRYSLRALLLLMTLICIVCGMWLNRAIRQRTAVRRFYELTDARGESHSGDTPVTMTYRYQGKNEYYKPILPKWQHPLRDALGEEAFGEVTGVQLMDTAVTDDDLRHLAAVPTIEYVNLSRTKITDAGLVHLRVCPKLNMLQLDGMSITDAGLEELSRHQGLQSLSLSNTKISDAGLVHLAKLPKLKELWLRGTAITDAGYKQLQAALPECEIQADVPSYHQKYQQLYWNTGTPMR